MGELMKVGLPGTGSAKQRDERGAGGAGSGRPSSCCTLSGAWVTPRPCLAWKTSWANVGFPTPWLLQGGGVIQVREARFEKRDGKGTWDKKKPVNKKEVKGPETGISQRGQGRKPKDRGDGQRAVSERVTAEGEQAEGSSRWTPKSPE